MTSGDQTTGGGQVTGQVRRTDQLTGGAAATGELAEIAVPDSTGPTIALLRELRHERTKKQAANAAYWLYLILFIAAVYGSSLIAKAFRALRHPPPPVAITPHVLAAVPAGLTALALLALLAVTRDGLWRGPVTLPQATVDWLLGTPVLRGRLLLTRFRVAVASTILGGALVGIVPAASLVALGLGGHDSANVLALTAASMAATALIFALGAGLAGLIERYRPAALRLRGATPVVAGVAIVFGGLAAWAAVGRPPRILAAITEWSGPWGWAAQSVTAMISGDTGAAGIAAGTMWPLAIALLAAAAVAALLTAQATAAAVPGSALRIRARTIGAMSSAALSMDTRGIAAAYADAGGRTRRTLFRLRPPRWRGLVVVWRDLVALGRAPSRLAYATALTLTGTGLIALAARHHPATIVLVGCGLVLGYLAAALLCEGAKLDADDTRRSAHLPFRYPSLAWRHAVVPCLVLLAAGAGPAIAASVLAGDWRFAGLLAVAAPVLVTGAMVNVFRGQLPLSLFAGVDTPVGNSAAMQIVLWYAWGPVLAIAPLAGLVAHVVGSAAPGMLTLTVIIGAVQVLGLGYYAMHRAKRLYRA